MMSELYLAVLLPLISLLILSLRERVRWRAEMEQLAEVAQAVMVGRPPKPGGRINSTQGIKISQILHWIRRGMLLREQSKVALPVQEIKDVPVTAKQLGEQILKLICSGSATSPAAIRIYLRRQDSCQLLNQGGLSSRRITDQVTEFVLSLPWGGSEEILTQESLLGLGIRRQLLLRLPMFDSSAPYTSESPTLVVWLGFEREDIEQSYRRGEVCRVLSQLRILSQQAIHIEHLENKLSLERDYFLSVSHDLKSPGISALYLLRELQDGGDESWIIEELRALLSEQQSLIQDFLDVERGRHSILQPNCGIVRVDRAIDEICSNLVRTNKSLALVKDGVPQIEISFDANHFKRIITNLLSNAVKYTEQGEVRLRCLGDEQGLKVEVSDTGPGIPPEHRKFLFQRFQRIQPQSVTPGNGIGLMAARLLAEANDANLSYRPAVSQGSIFTLHIPAARILKVELLQQTGVPDPLSQPKTLCSRQRRVLILEDDEASCRLYSRILKGLQIEVTVATTVSQACRQMRQGGFDLLLADYRLRDGTYHSLLQEPDYQRKPLPTIIVSGAVDLAEGDQQSRREQHIIASLEKPIERYELERVVMLALAQAAQRPMA